MVYPWLCHDQLCAKTGGDGEHESFNVPLHSRATGKRCVHDHHKSNVGRWGIAWWCHQMGTFSALLALCAGNHRSPVNSPHKGQWRRALVFSLICGWTNASLNNRDTGDLRRHSANYDVIVMVQQSRDNSTTIGRRHRTIACFLWYYSPQNFTVHVQLSQEICSTCL